MFLIPLNQMESVELVIHALRAAGGDADCSQCPVRKVCMKQCLAIATAIRTMVDNNQLPSLGGDAPVTGPQPSPGATAPTPQPAAKKGHLSLVRPDDQER